MALKGKLEAIIYAAEEPVTLDQLTLLLKESVIQENGLTEMEPTVAQAEAKKSHLITVVLARLGFQVARVVPPLGFEVGMGEVVRRKGKLSSRHSEPVGEAGYDQPAAN